VPVKPSDAEEEYFKLEELRALKAARERAARETAAREREELKGLHWMRCPKCGLELAEVDYKGVTVDACFGCQGMFFDQGEVEKIVEHHEPGLFGRINRTLFGS